MEFLTADWLGTPAWFWLSFLGLVAALTAFDLGVWHKEDREMGIAESLKLSAFYIAIAIAFGAWIWVERGADLGMKYYTGFFIEKALSIDNVFVISLIFSFFAIPRQISVSRPGVGDHRGDRAARDHDRGGRGVGRRGLLGAVHLRRVPDRDGDQDVLRRRQADGRRQQPGRAVDLVATCA